MGRDFGAATLKSSIQTYKAIRAVRAAAPGAQLPAVDQAQAGRPAGAGGAMTFDVRAGASVLSTTDTVALAATAGALASLCYCAISIALYVVSWRTDGAAKFASL